jgi:hypothetical protein
MKRLGLLLAALVLSTLFTGCGEQSTTAGSPAGGPSVAGEAAKDKAKRIAEIAERGAKPATTKKGR